MRSTHSFMGSRRSTSAFETTRTSTTISFRAAGASARTGEVLGGHEARGREASHETIREAYRQSLEAQEVRLGASEMPLLVLGRGQELKVIFEIPGDDRAVVDLPLVL